MLLLNENIKPNKTIYYLSSLIYKKIIKNNYTVRELYNAMLIDLNDLDYDHYIYALNFLFLLEKIKLEKDVIKKC